VANRHLRKIEQSQWLRQADVNTNRVGERFGAVPRLNLALKDDVELAGLAGEDRRRGLAGQAAMPSDLDATRDADDRDATVL
jgi:hypothetical protein